MYIYVYVYVYVLCICTSHMATLIHVTNAIK